VFEHVAVIAPPSRLARQDGGNFVMVASDAPLDVEGIEDRNAARGDDDDIITSDAVEFFGDGAPMLTDDYAPVDQLMNPQT
jgi:hypothetical protein